MYIRFKRSPYRTTREKGRNGLWESWYRGLSVDLTEWHFALHFPENRVLVLGPQMFGREPSKCLTEKDTFHSLVHAVMFFRHKRAIVQGNGAIATELKNRKNLGQLSNLPMSMLSRNPNLKKLIDTHI